MIAELLPVGRENARRGKEICKILGVTEREFHACVERERRAGAPICACKGTPGGYYIAKDKAEMKEFCARLERESLTTEQTRTACVLCMDKLPERCTA